jgi:hypothetical protein
MFAAAVQLKGRVLKKLSVENSDRKVQTDVKK